MPHVRTGISTRLWTPSEVAARLKARGYSSGKQEGRRRVLAEGLTALAAAGGTAVVQAAGTDAWNEFRRAMAALLGRGENGAEQTELERLDQTATALTAVAESDAEQARTNYSALWQARLEALLEGSEEPDRARLAAELRGLVDPSSASRSTVAGNNFHGPTAVQTGNNNSQHNHFGPAT